MVCPQGWTYYNDRCWFKSSHESSWFDGDQECRQRYGASLATIQSEKEARFIGHLKNANEAVLKFFDQSDPHFMDCFTMIKGAAILGASVMSPSNIKTAEQCVEECAKAEERYDQICKSALWYRESKECVLNDKTKNDTEVVFVEDPEISGNIDYYEKICDLESEESESLTSKNSRTSKKRKGEIIGIRSCFSKFKHSSLVGFADRIHDNLTERECLTKCWRCEQCLTKEKEPCKSVIYYESMKQCVLTKESRRTQMDYFDQTEPLATFFERRKECLFEMCEDLEIDLIFAIDGSAKMNWYGFDKALRLVDSIVTGIHEVTEFWKLTLVQTGTEGPAVVEIERKSFDTLDDFRRALATVGWRRSPGNRLGDSLVDVADLAMRTADKKETDFVWMLTLTPGFSNDSLDDFELMKNENYFTSFAIGVGSDLDYVNLQKIATSNFHLIHSQESKTIVKEITSKLCPPSGVTSESKNQGIESSVSKTQINEEFVSKKDAYKTDPWILHDESAITLLKNKGVKTKVTPSTIAFIGGLQNKNIRGFRKFFSKTKEIKKLVSDFVGSVRNDSFADMDEEEYVGEKFWIGFKRSDLGPFEWSDGSRLEKYESEKSRHLEVELDSGDCIYWLDNLKWNQSDCFEKFPFICNLKPTQTINEKLEHDFGNFEFDLFNTKLIFENNLEPFKQPKNNEIFPEPQSPPTQSPQLFFWGPDEKFTTKVHIKPPSATPPTNFENTSGEKEADPEVLLKSGRMSNILIPFGG